MLGIEHWSSARAVGILNCSVISPTPLKAASYQENSKFLMRDSTVVNSGLISHHKKRTIGVLRSGKAKGGD